MGCKELIPSSIVVLAHNCKIGFDGHLTSFSTSDTASDNASSMHSMNYRRRSTRYMIVQGKGLVNNTENMHPSVMVSVS